LVPELVPGFGRSSREARKGRVASDDAPGIWRGARPAHPAGL